MRRLAVLAIDRRLARMLITCSASWRPVNLRFAHACYFRVGPATYLTLLTRQQPVAPAGVVLDHADFRTDGWPLADEVLVAQPYRLRFLRAAAVAEWTPEAECDLGITPGSVAPIAARQLQAVARRLWQDGTADYFGHLGPWAAPLRSRLARVCRILKTAEPRGGLPEALAAVVGLGIGQTPSGDDALTGMLAVFAAHSDPRWFARLARGLRALAPLTGSRTTLAGGLALQAACRRQFARPIRQALAALAAGSPEGVSDLVGLGHTSGRDVLAGMLTAGDMLVTPTVASPPLVDNR